MGNSAEINANVYTQTTDEGLRRGVEDVGQALTSSKKNEKWTVNETCLTGFRKSGREDLNLRPPGPEQSSHKESTT